MHLKTYKEFLNEKMYIVKDKSLWRNTAVQWLEELIKKGEIKSKTGRYISFSMNEDSGGQDDFGDVCIEFDADMLYKQGAMEVGYDPDFMEQHKDICLYVTGYRDKAHYESEHDPEDDEELSWETYLGDYEEEAEVVLKNLKYHDGLVKSVYDSGESGYFHKNANSRNLKNEGPVEFNFLKGTGIKIKDAA